MRVLRRRLARLEAKCVAPDLERCSTDDLRTMLADLLGVDAARLSEVDWSSLADALNRELVR